MKPEYAEGLVSQGTIRIGTLYEYRDSEDARADKMEGARQFIMTGSYVNTSENTPEAAYLKQKGFSNCIIQNHNPSASLFCEEILSKDRYIYCVSSEFDKDNMRKFGGACIRINCPSVFFSILDASLKDREAVAEKHEMSEIFYCPRDKVYTVNQDAPKNYPGWIVKPNVFRPEKEIRVSWEATKETDLKPTLIVSESETYRTLAPLEISVSELCGSHSFERIV